MINPATLALEARQLPKEKRREILAAFPEVELHHHLAALFRAMSPDAWVEVTHGATEFGKDLVIVRTDPLVSDVIGVVVKCGDIRGRTSGDVDSLRADVEGVLTAKGERITQEVLSQIRQATTYDAVLKSHIQELKVSSVMVVLAGEFSGNARKRIEGEVGPLAGVRDMPWLVDNFTDYYPQVFFEAQALDYLYQVVETLDKDSFHAKSGKTLTECYVDPVLVPMDAELSFDDATNLAKVKRRRLSFAQLAAGLTPRKRILIVGDPGSGKSKIVAKYCIDSCRAAINRMTRRDEAVDLVRIPQIVAARHLRDFDTASLLLDSLLPENVRQRLAMNVLVVDGLDEVPGDERETVLRKAEDFATALDVALIVTSRPLAAFTSAPKGFSRFEILPFEFGQAMKLVNKVLLSQDVLPALKVGMEKIQEQLPMNPLSLILLIEVVAERKEVPASLTELYERFLDLVFGRWDKEKGLEVLFEYIVKKRFLASLAYTEFFQKDRLEISAQEFKAFVDDYSRTYGWGAEQLLDFVKEIERAGILETSDDVLFRHRSFLDFFVAHHLHEQRQPVEDVTSLVARTYHDPLWTETAFFYAGLSREITQSMLDQIFAYGDGDSDFSLQKLMVGRLLQAGWHSPTAVKSSGIRQALANVPDAAASTMRFLQGVRRKLPSFFGELAILAVAKSSLGSMTVSSEAAALLNEMQEERDLTKESLLKRAALLWSLQRHLEESVHGAALKQFVADVGIAKLDSIEEARLLLIAGLSDPIAEVRKLIGRRIRRIEEKTPNAIAALLPGKKVRFTPPPKRRR